MYSEIVKKVPTWLIALSMLILIGVVLDQVYHRKECVNIWGLELNKSQCKNRIELEVSKSFWWRASDGEGKPLIRTSEGVCFLTTISGPFNHHRDLIGIETEGGWWKLKGTFESGSGDGPSANRPSVRARCIKYGANIEAAFSNEIDD